MSLDNRYSPRATFDRFFDRPNDKPSAVVARAGGSGPHVWIHGRSSPHQFAGPRVSETGQALWVGDVDMDDDYGSKGERTGVPEQVGPSTPGPFTRSYPAGTFPREGIFGGLLRCPFPVTSLWGYPPSGIKMGVSAGNGTYDPLTAPGFFGQRIYPTSVAKGTGRAMGDILPTELLASGKTMRPYQQPCTPEAHSPSPGRRTDTNAPNTVLPSQVAPATGSVRFAMEKGNEMGEGEGRRKPTSKKDLPPGVDWPTTCRRLRAAMNKIYVKSNGEVTDPKTAYAEFSKFLEDDLHLSPLMVNKLGEHPSRDTEQYLIQVLYVLCPGTSGKRRGARIVLEQVLGELEDGLVAVNDDPALRGTRSAKINREKLDAVEEIDPEIAARLTRDGVRRVLERMTLFLKKPSPRYSWSRNRVLFFAVTYVLFGAGAFGDGDVLFTPKPPQ